jgi:voltage-gated potassium channel Kch
MNPAKGFKIRKNPLTGYYRFSVAEFLAALVVFLFTGPFVARLDDGDLIDSVLLTLVLVSAVLAVGHRRWVFWLSVLLVLPPLLGKWLYHFWPGQTLPEIYLAGSILFLLFIISQFFRFILNAPRVDSEVLCAGISSYLMLGLLWAFAYSLVAHRDAGAFAFNAGPDAGHVMNGFNSLYFSFVTMSTVGYGDITPVSDVARMLAAAEAMTGTLFVAVLISRLVSMYSKQPPGGSEAGVSGGK